NRWRSEVGPRIAAAAAATLAFVTTIAVRAGRASGSLRRALGEAIALSVVWLRPRLLRLAALTRRASGELGVLLRTSASGLRPRPGELLVRAGVGTAALVAASGALARGVHARVAAARDRRARSAAERDPVDRSAPDDPQAAAQRDGVREADAWPYRS